MTLYIKIYIVYNNLWGDNMEISFRREKQNNNFARPGQLAINKYVKTLEKELNNNDEILEDGINLSIDSQKEYFDKLIINNKYRDGEKEEIKN